MQKTPYEWERFGLEMGKRLRQKEIIVAYLRVLRACILNEVILIDGFYEPVEENLSSTLCGWVNGSEPDRVFVITKISIPILKKYSREYLKKPLHCGATQIGNALEDFGFVKLRHRDGKDYSRRRYPGLRFRIWEFSIDKLKAIIESEEAIERLIDESGYLKI